MGLVPARDDDSIDIVTGLLRRVDELERLGAARWGVFFEAWQLPSFTNSWVNFTGETTRYRKESSGIVRIEGTIKSGTNNATAFTLPAGFRPPFMKTFTQQVNVGGTDSWARLDVEADGDVIPRSPLAGASIFFGVNVTFAYV